MLLGMRSTRPVSGGGGGVGANDLLWGVGMSIGWGIGNSMTWGP